ncbi:MAG: ribose 5-phosphate isomerase B [Lachnospiraceae bacterium]|nr:ribose 5-phosphate isomerase B [Lachnospiraceae bacterium]
MKIAIGCDHGAYDMKLLIMDHLKEKGHELVDFGSYDKNSIDYPAIGLATANAVAGGECDKGIVLCTTGIGISIVANKVKGIRAALCNDCTSAKLTRMHNDANVLALGGGVIGPNLALDIVDIFFSTEFSGEEKHVRRLSQIAAFEEEK